MIALRGSASSPGANATLSVPPPTVDGRRGQPVERIVGKALAGELGLGVSGRASEHAKQHDCTQSHASDFITG